MRILIADDQPDLLAILSARFHALGFDVDEARNGEEVLQRAHVAAPDVFLLDVMMPELNGFQVCRRIREDPLLRGIPVVMLTAKQSAADAFWGAEVGADLYLSKPMDPAQVVHHVQELLRDR